MNYPEISLISHSSILIKVGGLKILTDPWYFGTAFNDGWELSPKPNLDDIREKVADVDIIWISHEHPDHLHFPTLKWLEGVLTKEVSVYFQKTNSTKVFDALKKIGYKHFVEMPHLNKIPVSTNVKIACYAHRHLDSALAVFIDDYFWLLNINDTELNESDISIIERNWGNPNVLYNQFSIAGSNGIETSLVTEAENVLLKMVEHHKYLKANLTVPFASYVKFARSDNSYVNAHANTAFDAQNKFKESGLNFCLQSYDSGPLIWSHPNELPRNMDHVNSVSADSMAKKDPIEEDDFNYEVIHSDIVKETIEQRVLSWRKHTNPLVWKLLKLGTIRFSVSDWDDEVWECDFNTGLFSRSNDFKPADMIIASQPLFYSFKMPFGIQTLGVSVRYKFNSKYTTVPTTWKKIRAISSLFNAEVYLSIKSIISRSTVKWIWERRSGISGQIAQQWKRFRETA